MTAHRVTSTLYQSKTSRVERASSEQGPVIVKSLRREAFTPATVSRYRREYAINRSLEGDFFCRAFTLIDGDGELSIVFEDCSGTPLNELLARGRLPLAQAGQIALGISRALQALHAQGVTHRNISSSNVLFDADAGTVKLVDFSHATFAQSVPAEATDPAGLAGTLTYIAPEQTGRLNRVVDSRADLYGAGVLMYELFTGRLPFVSHDPLELIHCHLARTPPVPQEINRELSPAIGKILLTLLAKLPDERYQTAAALANDLEQVLDAPEAPADFVPACGDAPQQLAFPRRLYGRDKQLRELINRLDQAIEGSFQPVLVDGPPGSGRSRLGRQFGEHARQRGARYLVFSPLAGARPVIELSRQLTRDALTRDARALERWRARLEAMLGPRLATATTLIPELSHALGEPQPVTDADLSATELMAVLVRAGVSAGEPLVIFVDDADRLEPEELILLVETLRPLPHVLLIVGADDAADLQTLLVDHNFSEVRLGGLDPGALGEFLADLLSLRLEDVTELAEALLKKTGGMPRVLVDFLASLHSQDLLYRTRDTGWRWRLAEIEAQPLPDTAGELVDAELLAMDGTPQGILAGAAVLGETFDLEELAKVLEEPMSRVASAMREARDRRVIVSYEPTGEPTEPGGLRYRFSHPQVRETAYSLLTPEGKQRLHLRCADMHTRATRDPAGLAAAAHHLNSALDPLVPDADLRRRAAEANLAAGDELAREGAHQPAFKLYRSGLALLGPRPWGDDPELASKLTLGAAAHAYLCGDFGQVERMTEEALKGEFEPIARTPFIVLKLRGLLARNQLTRVLEVGREAISDLGFAIRPRADWRQRSWVDPQAPPMANPAAEAAMQLLAQMIHAATHCAPEAVPVLARYMLDLTRAYGIASSTSLAAAYLAMSRCSEARLERAMSLANSAMGLAPRNSDPMGARTETLVRGVVEGWMRLDPKDERALEAQRRSLRMGDAEFAIVGALSVCVNRFLRGAELRALEAELSAFAQELSGFRHITSFNVMGLYQQVLQNLTGQAISAARLRGDVYHEQSMVPIHRSADDRFALAHYYLNRLFLDVLFNDSHATALTVAEGIQYDSALAGSPTELVWLFLRSLAELQADEPPRAGPLKAIRKRVSRLRKWTRQGAALGRSKLWMLEAELERVAGRSRRAEDLYERAAAHARENAHLNDEALAYELAGRHARASGKDDHATVLLRNAHNAYLRWGANAKAEQMTRTYSAHLRDATPGGISVEPSGDLLDGARLDADAVISASQTLSSEVVTDRVLDNLLRLAIGHAGAQKACLLLAHTGGLALHAMTLAEPYDTRLMSPPVRLEECTELPGSIVYYVSRTREVLCLGNARTEELFRHDAYVAEKAILSVLVVPLLNGNELKGILYLEHAELPEVFTPQRTEVIRVLATQAAISLVNAQLYARLGDARDEYRALWESATEGLFRMTPPGGLIRANPAFASTLGFANVTDALTEYADLASRLFASGNDAREFISKIGHGGTVQGLEARCVRADGSSIWLSISAELRFDIDGRPTHVDASLTDISERKAREQAERERNVAEAAAKAKSDFLAHMSHEIRTPMNAIVGFTRLALDGELTAEQRSYLDSIDGASRTLLAIINDILDFSKIEAGKLALASVPLLIDALMDELEAMFAHEAEEKMLDLRFEDKTRAALPEHGYISGDPLRLKQVLTNLISNALKFTDRGRVTVTSEICDDGESIDFAVADSGIGISGDILQRLFEPFEQAESAISRRYDGTGLGLSICNHLVELMDGEIGVESIPGEGSRFHFRLPLHIPSEVEVHNALHSRPQHAHPGRPLAEKLILLAEDNPINQKLARHFLERAGAAVATVDNGRAAVELSAQKQFDAILMDLHMPEMDGLDACRAIRRRGDELPIIAVSADAMTRNLDIARAAGFDDYLLKPIDYDTLIHSLTRTLTERLGAPRIDDVAGVIDLRKALKYHAQDSRLLKRLLDEFVRHYHDADERMDELIASGNLSGAERLAHNLVGVGGSFGADVLAASAAELESALEKRETGDLKTLQCNLERALSDVLVQAREFQG